jgi:hypothetical protein
VPSYTSRAEAVSGLPNFAAQVLGGAGYVQDYPVEQLYRDNRLNMIHEGTSGIHAVTLLGRKVQQGKANILFSTMREAVEAAEREAADTLSESSSAILAECSHELRLAIDRVASVTDKLTSSSLDKGQALANAHDYMTLLGHTVVAWTWLRIATAATQALGRQPSSTGSPAHPDSQLFYEGKLHTAAFFFRHELPKVILHDFPGISAECLCCVRFNRNCARSNLSKFSTLLI